MDPVRILTNIFFYKDFSGKICFFSSLMSYILDDGWRINHWNVVITSGIWKEFKWKSFDIFFFFFVYRFYRDDESPWLSSPDIDGKFPKAKFSTGCWDPPLACKKVRNYDLEFREYYHFIIVQNKFIKIKLKRISLKTHVTMLTTKFVLTI